MIKLKFTKIKKPFVIAEIGNNHEGSIENALRLIDKAKQSGASAVKFQTFIPELYSNLNDKKRQRILKKFQLSYEDFYKLSQYANKKNIFFGSTPFDIESALFLKKICSFIKISSGDNNYYQMIELVKKFKKPLIISTGLLDTNEIIKLYKIVKKNFINMKDNLCFMHCISSYPANYSEINLSSALKLKELFPIQIGLSDHSQGPLVAMTAVTLGINIIEKHFTLDKNFSKFRDHAISSDPVELKNMINNFNDIHIILGGKNKIVTKNEKKNMSAMRRSLYAKKDLFEDDKITASEVLIVRPGGELNPIDIMRINNKIIKKKIKKNSVISLKNLK
jgi:N,N'-diacetyllegionaminate synthase